MKVATTLKTLALFGLTSLSLLAGTAQADNGYGYYGGYPNVNQNSYPNSYPNSNPWVYNQANQQANYQIVLRERVAQLDQRQDAQMQRILNGMENGKLTMNEAIALLREHLAISNLERKYLADGRLGPNELRALEERLAEAGKHIKFETKDREQAGGPQRPGEYGRR